MKYKIKKLEDNDSFRYLIENTDKETFNKAKEEVQKFDDLEESFLNIFSKTDCYGRPSVLLGTQLKSLNEFTREINLNSRNANNNKRLISAMVKFFEEEILHLIEAYDDFINGLYEGVWEGISEEISKIDFDSFKSSEEIQVGIFGTRILEAGFIALNEIVRICSLVGTLQMKIESKIDIIMRINKRDKTINSFGMIAKQHLKCVAPLAHKCTIPSLVTYCDILTKEICIIVEPLLLKSLSRKSLEEVMTLLDCSREEAEELFQEEIKIVNTSYNTVLASRNILSYRELNRLAKEQGFEKVRQRGDHGIFKRLDGSLVVIPQGRMVGTGLNLKIQKDLAQ